MSAPKIIVFSRLRRPNRGFSDPAPGTEKKKTMTARDVTEFYAFFLRPETPHLQVIFVLKYTVHLEKKGKSTGEK